MGSPTKSRKKPEPVSPVVELVYLDRTLGTGAVTIDGTAYYLSTWFADNDALSVLGYRLIRRDKGRVKQIDIDAGTEYPTCDCEDATYTLRPGGCKHCVALAEIGLVRRIPVPTEEASQS